MSNLNRFALTEIREAKGVTKAELGKAVNLSRASITRFENGERNANDQQIAAIAKALNVNVLSLTIGSNGEAVA